jgi:hypothetical protein
MTLIPRSTWAFNNGPAGNFAQIGWKTGDKVPRGIDVEACANQSTQDDPSGSWVKTTRSKVDLTLLWKVQLYILLYFSMFLD